MYRRPRSVVSRGRLVPEDPNLDQDQKCEINPANQISRSTMTGVKSTVVFSALHAHVLCVFTEECACIGTMLI